MDPKARYSAIQKHGGEGHDEIPKDGKNTISMGWARTASPLLLALSSDLSHFQFPFLNFGCLVPISKAW